MKEYTLEASDEIEARKKALEMVKTESSLASPDCKWIAISWRDSEIAVSHGFNPEAYFRVEETKGEVKS